MKNLTTKTLNKLAKQKKLKGFTLIEMVIVIAIIALLILIVLPNLSGQKNKAQNKTDEAFVTTLQTAVDLGDGETSFDQLQKDGYLTEAQLKKSAGYEVINGKVQKK